MKKGLILASVLLAVAGLVLIAAALNGWPEGNTGPEYVLTYAENQSENYPTTRAAYRFAEMVFERTDGKVEIQIHPDSKLGDETSVVEQIAFGGIDFARVSLSTMADAIPQLSVLQMPFLYRDSEHMWQVLDGELGEEFMSFFEGTRFVPLSWYDAGARCFYTRETQIRNLEDLQGLKIRVPESRLLADLLTALGAEPVPMAFDRVYSALETGEIDGAENNWPSYKSMKHDEVSPYFTVDEHCRIPEVQMVSRHTWEKLPEEYREIIRQCARESAGYERRLWKEQERNARTQALADGCVEIQLDPGERERFEQAAAPVYEKYCRDYMDLVRRIEETGQTP